MRIFRIPLSFVKAQIFPHFILPNLKAMVLYHLNSLDRMIFIRWLQKKDLYSIHYFSNYFSDIPCMDSRFYFNLNFSFKRINFDILYLSWFKSVFRFFLKQDLPMFFYSNISIDFTKAMILCLLYFIPKFA
jgi:hypothetical protein